MYILRVLMITWLAVPVFFLFVPFAQAGGVVAGKYLQNSGREIVLELTIGKPAPASLILKQQLPKGTRIIHAAPPLKKYTPANGRASWLITGLRPGRMVIRVQLANSLQPGSVSAEVRCKDPATGRYVTTRIP